MICAYVDKENPNDPPGFMQPELRSIQNALKSNSGSELARVIEVTAVLPLKCPRTTLSRKIKYANGTYNLLLLYSFYS